MAVNRSENGRADSIRKLQDEYYAKETQKKNSTGMRPVFLNDGVPMNNPVAELQGICKNSQIFRSGSVLIACW